MTPLLRTDIRQKEMRRNGGVETGRSFNETRDGRKV